ncbi:YbaB/EbfC family nucleoid-associated protein [Saccharopolyspora sp. K220]|uniref:YbaB/EbfC family nucleoid-associated protein n=1 Tax=Saccharopolyspora soli TaxID=2926618 RepID=UPI001F578E8B|nr:YbaB/EbfC family nucleoid-associated protein [Saccharopolyspora soli]MCI2421207.1 YbaB/EbfC family nucleoid-associated protein [Saccharopolyspora soli]
MDYEPMSVNPVFRELLDQLKEATRSIPETQRRMMDQTGVAFSPDRMVKVVVGPRGQLVDLEIDPRVFRQPNAAALSAMILQASRDAVTQVTESVQRIMNERMPPELAEIRAEYQPDQIGADDHLSDLMRSDAERYAERKEQS